MTEFAIWKKPEGVSSNKNENIIKRASNYRFNTKHYLKDGTRVVPKLTTVFSILEAHDQFDLCLAVDSESYDIYVETK